MQWLKDHPFASLIGGTVLVVVLGLMLAWDSIPSSSSGEGSTWGRFGFDIVQPSSGGTSERDAFSGTRFTEEDVRQGLSDGEEYTSLIPRTNVFESTDGFTLQEADYSEDDITALLASLSPSAHVVQTTNAEGNELTLDDIYAFLPTVFSQSEIGENETREQRDLYTYGNYAGSYIQAHGEKYVRTQGNILRQFFEDRGNVLKAERAQEIADALLQLGSDLREVSDVPTVVQPLHNDLADGYEGLGILLSAVVNAESDEEMLAALELYNAGADEFAKTYVALVTLFSVHEVTFRNYDPGSVFVFTSL